MNRDAVLEAIETQRARLLAAVEALEDASATAPVTGEGWTAKDVLAHCIHWVGQIAFGLGAQLQPPGYVVGVQGRPTEEEWNAKVVAFYAPLSLDEVRAELERVTVLLEECIRLRTDADMLRTDAVPWGDGPLWRQIGVETFLHWPRHVAELETARRKLSS